MSAAAHLTTPLPKPPKEVPVDRALDLLAPKFQDALFKVLDGMHAKKFDAMVFEAIRSNERQEYLYGFGREYDDDRGIVTMSPTAETSWHFYGLAVDIISASRKWNASNGFWFALGEQCLRYGLVWGGSWKTFPDKPHVQWGGQMRRSPSPKARELYEAGGMEAVWAAVGAD